MTRNRLALGKISEVEIEQIDSRGAWVSVGSERLLLPQVELTPEQRRGEKVRAFIFLDQNGEVRATLRLPLAEVGEFSALRVKKVVREGANFDLGRGFDLPVAIEEIPFVPKVGERTLVRVELDEDGMLCGSCRIADFLDPAEGLQVGQQVDLLVWRKTDLGMKMIIDGRFEGLLYADELPAAQIGQRLVGFVARLREDGKIDLSLNPGGKAGVDIGCEKILQALTQSGFLPLNDSSSPDEIRRLLGLSKKQFKRAAGNLYKQKKIEILQSGIRLAEQKRPVK